MISEFSLKIIQLGTRVTDGTKLAGLTLHRGRPHTGALFCFLSICTTMGNSKLFFSKQPILRLLFVSAKFGNDPQPPNPLATFHARLSLLLPFSFLVDHASSPLLLTASSLLGILCGLFPHFLSKVPPKTQTDGHTHLVAVAASTLFHIPAASCLHIPPLGTGPPRCNFTTYLHANAPHPGLSLQLRTQKHPSLREP